MRKITSFIGSMFGPQLMYAPDAGGTGGTTKTLGDEVSSSTQVPKIAARGSGTSNGIAPQFEFAKCGGDTIPTTRRFGHQRDGTSAQFDPATAAFMAA